MSTTEPIYQAEEIKKGGEELFKKLYIQSRPVFIQYMKNFQLCDEDCKDLYQDSFMTFYKNIISGKIINLNCKVSTYIIGIGKYKLLENKRDSQRFIIANTCESFSEETIEINENFFDEDELSLRQQILYQVFKKLGQKCKDILHNFYYEGLSLSEIKKFGGYNSKNVVKAQKSRCIKTLKDYVKS